MSINIVKMSCTNASEVLYILVAASITSRIPSAPAINLMGTSLWTKMCLLTRIFVNLHPPRLRSYPDAFACRNSWSTGWSLSFFTYFIGFLLNLSHKKYSRASLLFHCFLVLWSRK